MLHKIYWTVCSPKPHLRLCVHVKVLLSIPSHQAVVLWDRASSTVAPTLCNMFLPEFCNTLKKHLKCHLLTKAFGF